MSGGWAAAAGVSELGFRGLGARELGGSRGRLMLSGSASGGERPTGTRGLLLAGALARRRKKGY